VAGCLKKFDQPVGLHELLRVDRILPRVVPGGGKGKANVQTGFKGFGGPAKSSRKSIGRSNTALVAFKI
jgi:hypothetical protein